MMQLVLLNIWQQVYPGLRIIGALVMGICGEKAICGERGLLQSQPVLFMGAKCLFPNSISEPDQKCAVICNLE